MIYDVGGARTCVRAISCSVPSIPPSHSPSAIPSRRPLPALGDAGTAADLADALRLLPSIWPGSHTRPQRSAWYSYFDDAHAILFLAPISCFDELLAEDRRVNRLEDSFLLWKGIVQSKLLAKCIIVRASLPCLLPRLS